MLQINFFGSLLASSLSQNSHYSERAIWLVALERARLKPCRPELIMTRASAPEGSRGPVTNSSRQATSRIIGNAEVSYR